MADYAKMYYLLCDAASRAIEALDQNDAPRCRSILRNALLDAENIYIATCGGDERRNGDVIPFPGAEAEQK